jgi:hypothetical protein
MEGIENDNEFVVREPKQLREAKDGSIEHNRLTFVAQDVNVVVQRDDLVLAVAIEVLDDNLGVVAGHRKIIILGRVPGRIIYRNDDVVRFVVAEDHEIPLPVGIRVEPVGRYPVTEVEPFDVDAVRFRSSGCGRANWSGDCGS